MSPATAEGHGLRNYFPWRGCHSLILGTKLNDFRECAQDFRMGLSALLSEVPVLIDMCSRLVRGLMSGLENGIMLVSLTMVVAAMSRVYSFWERRM